MHQQVAAVVGVLVALTLAACDGRDPTGPTPVPMSVSITERTTPVGLGEHVCTTFRLSRPPHTSVKIWTNLTGPDGVSFETEVPFPIGVPTARYTTPANVWGLGNWTARIMGERLPAGVVLGDPSSATTTVQESATGVDCRHQS